VQTELLDTALELGQLLLIVGAGVAGPRFEIARRAINEAACKVVFKYFGVYGFHRKVPFLQQG